MMNHRQRILIAALAGLCGITVFHLVHYVLYCRYRTISGRNHCGVCGHRRICQKYHSRKQ